MSILLLNWQLDIRKIVAKFHKNENYKKMQNQNDLSKRSSTNSVSIFAYIFRIGVRSYTRNF